MKGVTQGLVLLLSGCQLGTSPRPADVAADAVQAVVPPAWADQVSREPDRIADVAEHAVQAVVHVAVSKRGAVPPQMRLFMQGAPENFTQRGAGSGVVVDARRGLIVTNHHVVEGADKLTVTLSDGRTLPVTVKGSDEATDVAVLQIEGPVPRGLPALAFGSSDSLRLGAIVLAIGSPFELRGSVTMGIVSAKDRAGLGGLSRYQDYIQTDAAINPGNSGGALVDLEGNLVGINTAIRSQSGGYDGIGFAIPADLARDVMERLVEDGRVVRGKLGVVIDDVDEATASLLKLDGLGGAVVSSVQPGSAAAKAGLEPYDVIVDVDGDPIAGSADLQVTVSLKGAGAGVSLGVVRDGRRRTVEASLDELDEREVAAAEAPEHGIGLLEGVSLMPREAAAAQGLDLDGVPPGAVVGAVAPGSEAAMAGLRPGMVILEVDRVAVASPDDVLRALDSKDRALLLVQAGPVRRLVTLR